MKILNLYAGIGGNRKLWGDEHEITAIEYDEKIAKVYQDYFPKDKVIITDAHQYLLEHFGEFDFIWSSPPCPSHSKINKANHLSPYKDNTKQIEHGGGIPPRYPDMKLYQEVIFLQHFCKAKWVVENVIPYYKPLIPPSVEIARHLFWSNFWVQKVEFRKDTPISKVSTRRGLYGFDLSGYEQNIRKDKILRNMVDPEIGEYILEQAFNKEPNTLLKTITKDNAS